MARAEFAGATQLAAQPLQMAQGKLARARTAAASRDNNQATMLAEQAEADADYATAVALSQKAETTAGEMQELETRATRSR